MEIVVTRILRFVMHKIFCVDWNSHKWAQVGNHGLTFTHKLYITCVTNEHNKEDFMTIATQNWDPVETEDDKKNSVPLNIRVPLDIRQDLDFRAKQLGWTRSQLVKMFLVEAMIQDEVSKEYQRELDEEPYLTEENEEKEYDDFTSALACIRADKLDDDCWYLEGTKKYNYHIQIIKKRL